MSTSNGPVSLGNNGAGPYAARMAVTPGSLVLDYSHTRLTDALIGQLKPAAVCRYLLDPGRDEGKALQPAEAQWLAERGLPIVGNFEYATSPNLTAAQGAADARIAHAELLRNGLPSSAPVIFSMDHDLTAAEITGALRYWTGAQSVLGWGNDLAGVTRPRAGLYGEYTLIQAAAAYGVHWLWQTYAWSGGRWSSAALLRQVRNNSPAGFDQNAAMAADFGQRFPLGYGDTMELGDKVKAGSLAKLWPPEANVKADTEFSVAELLLAAAARPAQIQSSIGAYDRAEIARDTAQSQALLAVDQLVRLGAGSIDIEALAQKLLTVLAPAQAIALSDVLRKTHLTVDGS